MLQVGLIGCGVVGRKRAAALANKHRLVVTVDADLRRAEQLAERHPGCVATSDWQTTVARSDIDLVMVSTTNDMLASITRAALTCGKHVLVEKPGARHAAELAPLLPLAAEANRFVKVGFNHRFHPALSKAKDLFQGGAIGELMFLRGRYGHGGRPGYDREWRADPAISGGGELLDQGVHLIDLARWFAGDFTEVSGHVATYFWDMSVEDNGFVSLRTAKGETAWLHASCTEWKNLFSLEIYGQTGKLHVEGLGGSYGVEKLAYYRMLPRMGPPETTIWEYPGEDQSWQAEFDYFAKCIEGNRLPEGNLQDAIAALEIIDKVYRLAARSPG